MQVSVETLNDLERRVTVRLPAETVTAEIQNRLQTLSRKVKVDGFRPGKAPLKLVKQLYGRQAQLETAGELMENSLHEALLQENLRPLGQPEIEPQALVEGQDFEYSATFEVAPQINLSGFETIQVTRPVVEVTEQDVEDMIDSLRWQQAVWHVVERPAAQNDRVRLDFAGTIDGQEFPGGKGENAEFILDGKILFKGFEAQLFGLHPGAATEFDFILPDGYPNPELVGKTAHFQVKLHTVEEAALPAIDDAFAEKFDIHQGGVTALRESLRDNMQRSLRETVKGLVKRQVTEGLFKANPIPVPRTLVAAEIRTMARQMRLPTDLPEENRRAAFQLLSFQAYHRVALGLLMSELVKRENIQFDEQRVRSILETQASTYQEPEEVLRAYEQDPQIQAQAQALALEDQIVDWLLERAQITEKPSSFAEVMNPRSPAIPGAPELAELADAQEDAPLAEDVAPADTESAPHA